MIIKKIISVASLLAIFAFYGTALAKEKPVTGTLICHRKGSHPYKLIRVSNHSLYNHLHNPTHDDFIAPGPTVESCDEAPEEPPSET